MNIIRNCFLLICILFVLNSRGQTVRTDVVVVGGTESGLAAAIQAAHSGAVTGMKVLLVVEKSELTRDISDDTLYTSGIRADFFKLALKARTDTISGMINPFSQSIAADVLKGWTDTVKNLMIVRNATFQKIEKSGKGWDIKLRDGKTIKANAVVDATTNGALAAMAEIPLDRSTGYFKTLVPVGKSDMENLYDNRVYRTSIGIGTYDNKVFMMPLGSLVAAGAENFILAGRMPILKDGKQSVQGSMASGQAAGAAAAFCAFFKTTTANLSSRVIQGELFAYRSWLMYFKDVERADSNFAAIQRIGLTGLLKGEISNGELFFHGDSTVSSEDIRQPMREYYSRSQIWFADNKFDSLTIENVLSLIKFNASRGEELNREVEKAWNTSFKFAGKYDPKRLVTRREFAVMADAYLKPFNVRIDIAGNLGS